NSAQRHRRQACPWPGAAVPPPPLPSTVRSGNARPEDGIAQASRSASRRSRPAVRPPPVRRGEALLDSPALPFSPDLRSAREVVGLLDSGESRGFQQRTHTRRNDGSASGCSLKRAFDNKGHRPSVSSTCPQTAYGLCRLHDVAWPLSSRFLARTPSVTG